MGLFKKLLLAGDAATELVGTGYKLLIVSNAAVAELAHGASGLFLKSSGSGADPTWDTPAAGEHALDAGQTDVTISDPGDDEVLSYETDGWINKTAAEAGLMTDPLTADCVGADEIDSADTGITMAQLIFTPVADGMGTAEGTVFYDSDLDHLMVYVV